MYVLLIKYILNYIFVIDCKFESIFVTYLNNLFGLIILKFKFQNDMKS